VAGRHQLQKNSKDWGLFPQLKRRSQRCEKKSVWKRERRKKKKKREKLRKKGEEWAGLMVNFASKS